MTVWETVFVAGFSATVVQALRWATDWVSTENALKKERKTTGIMLAHMLERFAYRCSVAAAWTETYADTDGSIGQVKPIPEVLEILSSFDLSILQPQTIADICSLEIEHGQALDKNASQAEFGGEFDYYTSLVTECYLIGAKAQRLANAVRTELSLPSPNAAGKEPRFKSLLEDKTREIREHERSKEAF